jgi:hypothetical protein
MLQFSIGTLQAENWTMGIDNTDGGSFKINNRSAALSTDSTLALRIDTDENISIPGNVSITGSVIIPGSTIPIDTAWTSYTPQWTSGGTFPVLNNGTATGAYKVIGKTCFVRGIIVMGTTTTYGTGAWLISLPITASLAQSILIPAVMLNSGVAWYSGLVNGGRIGNTSKAEIQWQTAAGTADPLSATVPFTWGSADAFSFNGSYEIA